MIPSQRIRTGQTSSSKTIPAPVGGLNGRDSLANMAETDAYLMDNILPGTATCDSRQGCEEFAATVNSPVRSLEVYAGADGDKMLSFAGGKIYDISTGIPSEKATGKNSDLTVAQMFSNAADNSQHLLITTGADTPYKYDGTSIADLTLTGVTGSPSTLSYVFAFKERVYFAQNGVLGFYYLPVGQIQGALDFFDLAQVAGSGGYLVAMASFAASGESGETPNDYIVFVTSKGECIVYSGYDPGDAANWSLVGRYYTSAPIGRKCVFNYNGELVIITLDGAIPFSEIRRTGAKQGSVTAITDKLGNLLTNLNVYASVAGWQGLLYPRAGLLLLNVPGTPTLSGAFYQYVMNTKTGAWARITNWDGLCFAVFNNRLYFGKYDGRVMLGDEGRNDDGEAIRIDVKQAYSYFEDGSGIGYLKKHFQWADALISCDGDPPISAKFNVDFIENQPEYIDNIETAGASWDTSDWDTSDWGFDTFPQHFFITLNDEGVTGSLWLRAALTGLTLRWYATKFVMEKTKGLL
jgi:hypothetical protein